MRRLMIAATAAALLLALAGPAQADEGPAGTSEEDNQLTCGSADADDVDLGNGIMVKTEGDQAAPQEGGALVVCNDGEDLPIQGRVIAEGGTEGGYLAADGDADNPSEESQGYARIDVGSEPQVRCGDLAAGDSDAANPDDTASQENCG